MVVANLVGRSESWLSQVERGLRSIDSHSVLVRLAEILDLEISQLTADEVDQEMSKFEAASAVRDAMLRYETLTEPAGCERPRLTWLGHELRRVTSSSDRGEQHRQKTWRSGHTTSWRGPPAMRLRRPSPCGAACA